VLSGEPKQGGKEGEPDAEKSEKTIYLEKGAIAGPPVVIKSTVSGGGKSGLRTGGTETPKRKNIKVGREKKLNPRPTTKKTRMLPREKKLTRSVAFAGRVKGGCTTEKKWGAQLGGTTTNSVQERIRVPTSGTKGKTLTISSKGMAKQKTDGLRLRVELVA